MTTPLSSDPTIRPLCAADVELCARFIAESDPWVTLGRTYDWAVGRLRDPTREIYVAEVQSAPVGVLILCMIGAFVGYIQTLGVAPAWRGRGIGSALLAFAEERIFRESPNVFLCVSSFNTAARHWYARHGYEVVGELRDYVLPGHSEFLLRKTLGPMSGFQPRQRGGGN